MIGIPVVDHKVVNSFPDPATASEEGTKKTTSKKPLFRIDYDKDIDFDKFFNESKV